jgi:hypothetical protein
MNHRIIHFNLEEAQEQLRATIAKLKDPSYSFRDFHVEMAHLYHHLNTAWNARNATNEQWRKLSDEDYVRWEQFPDDLPMIGDDKFYDGPEYQSGENA